ncbi:MAG TPA: hypothetical protein PKV66_02025 [Candidatus Pelethenecus sp.]|nr:hypothetical protein [Candidatus Pelethenecus sp.]
MQQLAKEEKEALAIFSEKYNVDIRIYFLENLIQVFVKTEKDAYRKIDFIEDDIDLFIILKKVESSMKLC